MEKKNGFSGLGSPFVDMTMSLEHESKGIKAYSRRDTQGKLNRTLLTGQGRTHRLGIKSLDFMFIFKDSGLCFSMFSHQRKLKVLCSHTISNTYFINNTIMSKKIFKIPQYTDKDTERH